MTIRDVTCKKCNVTNVGSTVYQAYFDLKHIGCNRLTAEYTYQNQCGDEIYSGEMNSKGVML